MGAKPAAGAATGLGKTDGLGYEGLLQIPADGGYTFTLLPSKMASLSVDAVQEKSGPLRAQVCGSTGAAVQAVRVSAALAAGLHRVEVRLGSEIENAESCEEPLFEPGSSVVRVARNYGVNANQVFQGRTLYRKGGLGGTPTTQVKLLLVSVAEEVKLPADADEQPVPALAGTIRIKLAGQASISVEGSVNPELICAVLECLRR